MSRNIFSRFLLTVLLLAAAGTGVRAQSYGAFTPYSIFGVGDLLETGSAYNRSPLKVTDMTKVSGGYVPTYKWYGQTAVTLSDFYSRWRCQVGLRLTF